MDVDTMGFFPGACGLKLRPSERRGTFTGMGLPVNIGSRPRDF